MSKFSDEDAQNEFSNRRKKFRKEDAKKIFNKKESLFEKFLNISHLKKFYEDFQDVYSLFKDYFNGNYKDVPWTTIAAIGGSLLYVISPFDLIPDFIPVIGYLDDAAVFAFCLNFIGKDLEKYRKWRAKQEFEYFKEINLGILGMQGAGKTRFLCHLRGVPFTDKATGKEPYDSFQYNCDDLLIWVEAGEDFGGGNLYRDEYDPIIDKSNLLFYFFDISKYLNNDQTEGISYRRASNSRIEHINSTSVENDNIIIVGTHLDLCKKSKEEIQNEFLKLNEDKTYYPVLKRIELINLTDKGELKDFTDKIFK